MRHETELRLRVDPVSCDGIGRCAQLAPDLVELDSWGFPIVDPTPFDDRARRRQATRAARACPRRALLLDVPPPRSVTA